jgi:hypothetical protein
MLLPAGTKYCGTAKHHDAIGEVQSAYGSILAQAGKTGNRAYHSSPAGDRAFIPMPEGRGLSPY